MEFKGTPGQWRYSTQFQEITTSPVGVIEGSKCIARLSDKPQEETLCNGKLIANAPALLKKLDELAEELEWHQVSVEKVKEARALIKEATEI